MTSTSGAAIQTKAFALASLLVFGAILGGCSQSEGNPDYNKEIKMTDEQKAKMEADLKENPAPGTVDPKTGIPGQSSPGTMKVPGKGGK